MNRFLCLVALLLSVACRDSETRQHVESAALSAEHLEPEPVEPDSVEPEHAEPDYEKLIVDLGITSLIQSMWEDEGGFLVTESAGASPDDVAAVRDALDILNPRQFQNNVSNEGILHIDFADGRTMWSTIINGRCCVTFSEDELDFSVSPGLLIQAFRKREARTSRGPLDTK